MDHESCWESLGGVEGAVIWASEKATPKPRILFTFFVHTEVIHSSTHFSV